MILECLDDGLQATNAELFVFCSTGVSSVQQSERWKGSIYARDTTERRLSFAVKGFYERRSFETDYRRDTYPTRPLFLRFLEVARTLR